MKDLYVHDLALFDENRLFESYFLVLVRQQRTTKTNKAYLSLILGDKTGQIEGRVWDPGDPRIQEFAKGDVIKARGSVSRFDGVAQLKVDQARRAQDAEYSRTDMLPSTTYDMDALWKQLEGYVAGFTDPDLFRLVSTVLADPVIAKAFREAPAAKQLHHAWLGGLLEHVVSLLGLADKVLPHYPMLHRDLVLTGVILHDMGKVRELAWTLGFEYTIEGQLLGHIHIGAAIAERTIDALPAFPPRLKTLVLHLILSHHGKLEFGSPKLPMIPEALVLNFLDDLDAKMATVALEFDKAIKEGKGPEDLTNKVWALDQRQMLNTKRWLEG